MTALATLRLKLVRDTHLYNTTGGMIIGGGLQVRCHESAWIDNKPLLSCIPLGTYRVMRMTDDADNIMWMVVGIPNRPSVEFSLQPQTSNPSGSILLHSKACLNTKAGLHIRAADTSKILSILMADISSFTLDIHQKLPYRDYLAEHGFVKPQTEEIVIDET